MRTCSLMKHLLLYPVILAVLISCHKNGEGEGAMVTGTVRSSAGNGVIPSAFIISGDSLVAVTNQDGKYETGLLKAGECFLLASAFGYNDQEVMVFLEEGQVENQDFQLVPDEQQGRIYGEFHDLQVFREKVIQDPGKEDWSEEEIFDGITGATIFTDFDEPASKLFIGDSLFAYADGYGQYWFKVQCGTYPVTGIAEGYRDTTCVVRVDPDSRIYLNFFMSEE